MNDTLTILEKLNQFYSSSFSHLVTITTGLLAFVGVVVPILITFYQNRQFKQEQSHIFKALEENKLELVKHIENEVSRIFELEKKKIGKEIAMLRDELIKESQQSKGGAFFIQANSLFERSKFSRSIESYINAIQCFINADDELNLQRASNMLLERCLPKTWKGDFECGSNYEDKIKDVTVRLGKINVNGRYTDLINKFSNSLDSALKRTEAP
ncbi:hypothetical protein [Aeromonas salmonicida]|uniref:hypothetical protein n=1 Tax=Aeromonas salmonicida TaxID=645 RepID=UPI00240E5918|nr:hypothetical protein [Aeromonas salmonicida]WFC12715.1 hypothetical protein L3V47_13260 [Aeromonas salmonicida]